MEGPDGQRFALERVRASTLVGDVARAVMNDYQQSGGAAWAQASVAKGAPTGARQQAVVDLVTDGGWGSRRLAIRA